MRVISSDELGFVFAQSLVDVVEKVSGIRLDVSSAEKDSDFDDVVCVMNLNGDKGGLVFISSCDASLRTLCSAIEGSPESEISMDDMEDLLCELVNMTAGSAKLSLSDTEYHYSLSSPLIIRGNNLSISSKKRVRLTSHTLCSGAVSMRLKTVF
ncbi:MAG: chemotaxis protein CheX [Oscillospiraceae bacterium]|nr:chemotaxis protein CheX [Oscillospiraceae bacterium]